MCVKCVTTGTTACRNSGLISIDCRVLLFIILFVWLRSTLNIGKGKPQYGHHTREFAELCNTHKINQNKQLRLVYYSLSEPLDTAHFVQRMNPQRTSVAILKPYTPLAVYGVQVHTPLAVYGVQVHTPLAVYGDMCIHHWQCMEYMCIHHWQCMETCAYTTGSVWRHVYTPLAVYGDMCIHHWQCMEYMCIHHWQCMEYRCMHRSHVLQTHAGLRISCEKRVISKGS